MARVQNSSNLSITVSGYSFTIDGGDGGVGGSVGINGIVTLSGTGTSTYTLQDKTGTAAFLTDINYAATSGSSGTSGVSGSSGVSVPNFYDVVTVGASGSLDTSYAFEYIRSTGASPTTLTIRQQSEIGWADNVEMLFEQAGAGQLTIQAGTNVTINTPLTLKTRVQYSVIAIQRDSTDVWTLFGDLALT